MVKSLKKLGKDLGELAERVLTPLGGINKERRLKPITTPKDGRLPTSDAPPGDEVRFRPTEPFNSSLRVEDYPQFNLPLRPINAPPPSMTRPKDVKPVTPIEVLEEVINNPAVQLTEDMLPAINDPGVFMQRGQLFGSFSSPNLLQTKKKRKVSKYQKEFGKQLKLLKKKHPRIPVTRLMKRAHAATRKALKR